MLAWVIFILYNLNSNIFRQVFDILQFHKIQKKNPFYIIQELKCNQFFRFVAQQIMIAVKKHFGTTSKKYVYLSGWMVAAMRSDFGPLPDQVSYVL